MEIRWSFIRKLKIDPPYDPAIPLLGLYLRDCKSTYKRDTCLGAQESMMDKEDMQ
jgi:hypothetical protein